MSDALVECVPNFSEGKNSEVIKEISKIIDEIEGKIPQEARAHELP